MGFALPRPVPQAMVTKKILKIYRTNSSTERSMVVARLVVRATLKQGVRPWGRPFPSLPQLPAPALRAYHLRSIPSPSTPRRDRCTIRARIRHENDTVSTWFLHGFYTVFSALKLYNPRSHQRLRRRKKHCFSAALRICGTNPPCIPSVPSADLPNEPTAWSASSCFTSSVASRPNEPKSAIRNPKSHKRTHRPALHFHAFRFYVIQ